MTRRISPGRRPAARPRSCWRRSTPDDAAADAGRRVGAGPAGALPAAPADPRVPRGDGRRRRSSCMATGCSATTRRSSPAWHGSPAGGVVVVGQQKGADTDENIRRNFGMPHPEGYRKAMRVDGARGAPRPAGHHLRRCSRRASRPGVGGARHRRGDRPLDRPDEPPAHADRHRHHRRGRVRRRAGHRRRRRRHRPRERGLLGHQPGGLRVDPVAHPGRGGHARRPRCA